MKFLLKDALKALCLSNHWSYAVFWKFGWKNHRLLIWEECHYETSSCSFSLECESESHKFSFDELVGCYTSENSSTQLGMQAGINVDSLIDKMMLNSQITAIGEGMVGRAAFTGRHQWVLSKNYTADADTPKVVDEVHQQFSDGIQTIAVIPIPQHGVVQLGSSCRIMESIGFVNDVKNLILNLVELPGALLSESHTELNKGMKIGKSANVGLHMSADLSCKSIKSSQLADCDNQFGNSCHASGPIGQLSSSLSREIKDDSKCLITMSYSHSGHCKPESSETMKPYHSVSDLQKRQVTIVSSNSSMPDVLLNQLACSSSGFDGQDGFCQSIAGHGNLKLIENLILGSEKGSQCLEECLLDGGTNTNLNAIAVQCSLPMEDEAVDDNHFGSNPGIGMGSTGVVDHLTTVSLLSNYRNLTSDVTYSQSEFNPTRSNVDVSLFEALNKTSTHPVGLKSFSEHVSGFACEYQSHASQIENPRHTNMEHNANAKPPSGDELSYILGVDYEKAIDSETGLLFMNMDDVMYSTSQTPSNTIVAETVSDNLLEAVISRGHFAPKQNSNDDVSCGTTLTRTSNSIPGVSPTLSFRSGCTKDDLDNCTKTTSLSRSQISSWVDQANSVKRSCLSAAYTKRSEEVNKSGRKRLKRGENPRPRPKDRQMIQDRVKELREIVPNGAKYSIDALLERTIKHMLFLQSVTKHADKLKQAGESKISKESGLFLKDNFENGATWAFEVGSQYMSCPIIVEDLTSPGKMLVEMLCEERGFFLEIAGLIRGMGLTILKGVMEARNGQLWAQFTVEATRDVTRMEVFMSLFHLLEHTMKGGSLADAIESKNMAPHNQSQAAPISATGGFHILS